MFKDFRLNKKGTAGEAIVFLVAWAALWVISSDLGGNEYLGVLFDWNNVFSAALFLFAFVIVFLHHD